MSILIEGSIGIGIGIFVGYASKPIFSLCAKHAGKYIFMYGKRKIYSKKIKASIDDRDYHRFSKYMYRIEKLDDRYDTAYYKKLIKDYEIEDDSIINKKEMFDEFCDKREYNLSRQSIKIQHTIEDSISIISDN